MDTLDATTFTNPTDVNSLGTTIPEIPTPPSDTTATSVSNFATGALQGLTQQEQNDRNLLATQEQATLDVANLFEGLRGEKTDLRQQEVAFGVDDTRGRLTTLNNLIVQKIAEVQQDDIRLLDSLQTISDQAIPMEFITGQQASVEQRARIARGLKMAEIGILNARVTAEQGNLKLALDQAQRAVDTKYAPIREMLQIRTAQLEALSPLFDRAEKREADALKRRNELVDRAVEWKRQDEKQNLQMSMDFAGVASEYGQKDLAGAFAALNPASPNFRKDLSSLISKVKDPKLSLSLALMQADLDFKRKQTALLGTPTKKELEETKAKLQNAKDSVPIMEKKIEDIEALKNSAGLNSRVGTSIATRTPTGFFGFVGKSAIPGVSMGLWEDWKDKLTGEGQDFAGTVHNLVTGLTLQELIDAKANGATFGALSDAELMLLSKSATKINDWEIKDKNGVGTGVWEINEEAFIKELGVIQEYTRRALDKAERDIVTDEERAVLESLVLSTKKETDYSIYYGQ